MDARNPGRKISRADHTVSLDDEYSRYEVRGVGWSRAIASRFDDDGNDDDDGVLTLAHFPQNVSRDCNLPPASGTSTKHSVLPFCCCVI